MSKKDIKQSEPGVFIKDELRELFGSNSIFPYMLNPCTEIFIVEYPDKEIRVYY